MPFTRRRASTGVSGTGSLTHQHELRFALEVQVRLAADVDRDPVDGAAGERVRRLGRGVAGGRLPRVTAHVEPRAGDGERAELGPDLPHPDLTVAVVERHGPDGAVRPLLLL